MRMQRAEGSLKQCLPNGKLVLLCLTKCHGVPCSLLSRMATKVLKTARLFLQDWDEDQDQMFKSKTKTSWFKTETKTKTLIFLFNMPLDQDPGLQDYITSTKAARTTPDSYTILKVKSSEVHVTGHGDILWQPPTYFVLISRRNYLHFV